MIPIRLHLSGFLSYQDPVDLDFSDFELACISGSNGAGKSSLLDAITWGLFGQARRRDDSLINSHAIVAEVTFDFMYENNLYRVQRSKPRDKSTVLEFLVCAVDGVWKPLTEKSMRETEARINGTLRMDYDTFINSSFLMQGHADQFAQQRPSDRKKVLSAILGLEVWEQYRVEAAERRKIFEGEIKALDAQIVEIDAELAQESERKQKLHDVEVRLEQLSQLRKDKENWLAMKQHLAAMLEEQRRSVELLERNALESRSRYNRLRAELDALNQEKAGYQAVLQGEKETLTAYQRWQDLRVALERWDDVATNFREIEARRTAPLTAITAEGSRLDQERSQLVSQEQAVLSEQARFEDLDIQTAALANDIKILEEALGQRAQLENDLRETQGRVAEASAENRSLRDAMKALKERIVRLNEVEGALCPLCGQPLSPEERANLVASLEGDGKEMGDRFRANLDWLSQGESQSRELQTQIKTLANRDEELRGLSRQHDRLEAEHTRIIENVASWNAGGALRLVEVSRMLSQEDFAHAARTELAEIDAQSKALGYDAAEHDAVRRAEHEGRTAETGMRALESARASLDPVERQIASKESNIAQESVLMAEQEKQYQAARERYEEDAAELPDLIQAEQEVFTIQEEENRLRSEVGMVLQSVKVLDRQRERRARIVAQRDANSAQIARLKTLEHAFSKDGVPALLIEQALPDIETEANEILDRLSNGQMSVHFETQRQFKDKSRDDRRETLDIIISDGAGPREYELFSGGEAFRINFAIRLALSRILAQRAGARLQMLVIDEGFGSQDADGRQRLIEAINQVRPDFQKILVITHMEELKEAFPARIEVEKTPQGSRVQVVV